VSTASGVIRGSRAPLEVVQGEGALSLVQVPGIQDGDAGCLQLRLEDGMEQFVLAGRSSRGSWMTPAPAVGGGSDHRAPAG